MDNLLLEAVVRDLDREVLGLTVHRVIAEGPDRCMLLLGDGWGEDDPARPTRRLHLGLEPGRTRLHLTRRRSVPAPTPTPFQGLLAREIEGLVLAGVRKSRWERVVLLELARAGSARRLAVELFGARGTLWLLDGEGRVLGRAGVREGLRPGERWSPPEPADRVEPTALDEAAFRDLAGPPEGLSRRLGRRLQGWSAALADDLERRARRGEDPWPAFRGMLDAIAAGRFAPRLLRAIDGDAAVLAPLAVEPPPGFSAQPFASASEALDAAGQLADAGALLQARRASVATELDREIRRLERLAGRLADDLAREDDAEEHVRRGNLLLAGLTVARVDGDRVTVPDVFDEAGGDVTLPIDPSRSLQENAERWFHRARKAKRGRRTVEGRLAEVRSRLPGLHDARGRLDEASTVDRIAAIEEDLARRGLLRLVRRSRTRKARAATPVDRALPVRVYRSADGLEVLVGKSGKENDNLTFRVAAPHDFWLHAQGWAGAHVVVRNPDRLPKLPRATLLQAAQLAAFHSKARGGGRVEVIVTQRRHVKKGRHLPPGAVRVQRHESVQVRPEMPFPEEV